MLNHARRKFLITSMASAGVASGAALASISGNRVQDRSEQVTYTRNNQKTLDKQAQTTAIPPFANVILGRMGFGAKGIDIENFNALGATNDDRLSIYVEQQLDWSQISDIELDSRISNPAYTTLDKTLVELWQTHKVDGIDYDRPLEEVERAAVLRAVYSKRQLLEFLTDFWHNHFNIYGRDSYARSTWTSWDRDVIRPPVTGFPRTIGMENGHLMGNFRDMLLLSSKHPAMLYFLDNHVNGRADPNENYAREVIELHTLGAMNYAGPDPQPGDINSIITTDYPEGVNDKYSDADVYEAMRFLTGWNIKDGRDPSGDENTGEWHFVPEWHDGGQKQMLGQQWDAWAGISEVYEMLDLLAYHPGTAQHIALKLCTRFLHDTPPQSLVDQVAQTFFDNRHAADQLEQVYRTLLMSNEFSDTSTWGNKLKRPFENIVSAMRACDANFDVRPDDDESYYLLRYMEYSGQRPFYWRAPDGYPDKRSFWEGGASLVNTWRATDWLIDENTNNSDPDLMPITQTTIDGLQSYTPDSMVEFWLNQILQWAPDGGWYGTELHSKLSQFMSTRPDDDPSPWPSDVPIIGDIDVNSWPYYWNERLRSLVKLVLSTPEFMQR